MGNCERLKIARRDMKLSQREFADKVGVSIGTIQRLEQDETTWDTLQDGTFDKVMKGLEDRGSWLKRKQAIEPEKKKLTFDDLPKDVTIGSEEATRILMTFNKPEEKKESKDAKTLEMLEFVMEGLRESETHEEFTANLKIMKRILKKF